MNFFERYKNHSHVYLTFHDNHKNKFFFNVICIIKKINYRNKDIFCLFFFDYFIVNEYFHILFMSKFKYLCNLLID